MPVKEVNKSEEVRKLHKSGVKKGSEIVEKLKARGINVAPSQVYQILAGKKGKKKSKKAASHSGSNGTVVDHAILFVEIGRRNAERTRTAVEARFASRLNQSETPRQAKTGEGFFVCLFGGCRCRCEQKDDGYRKGNADEP